jgi:RNA polymerase sigma factor (sigma-70 family)
MDDRHSDENCPGQTCQQGFSLQPGDPEKTLLFFITRYLSITDPSSYCGRICGAVIFSFIRRTLQNYKLDTKYNEKEILNEVFIRALKALESGKTITNLQAWVRGTSLNIIRELSRRERNAISTENWDDFADVGQLNNNPLSLMEIEEELKTVHQAFKDLQTVDQAILILKVIQGLSWEQVSKILEEKNLGSFSVVCLRKRKERALDRLRISLTS